MEISYDGVVVLTLDFSTECSGFESRSLQLFSVRNVGTALEGLADSKDSRPLP